MTDQDMIDYVNGFAFETWLRYPNGKVTHEFPFGATPGYDMAKAIAVNIGLSGPWMFDKVWRKECPTCGGNHPEFCSGACHGTGYIEPYDLLIAFVRRADKLWHVWLYSTKEHVDCGTIARSFGGHGDKGAAEFTCEHLPFEI